MGQEFFEIWDKNSKEYVENCPTLETFLIDSDKALGAVLVLPGGGYRALAQHEAGCIGQAFNEQGFHAFVLKYRKYNKYLFRSITYVSKINKKIRFFFYNG